MVAAFQVEPRGCEHAQDVGHVVADDAPGGHAVQPTCPGWPVGLQKLGSHWQMPPASLEPCGHELTQTPPLHSPLKHWDPSVQEPPLFLRQLFLTSTLPGSQRHALSDWDHVAPLLAGQVQADEPACVDVEPPPQSTQGERPPGP